MREFTVQGKDCCLYCREQGEGAPLLLIHGVACDSTFFGEAAQQLQEDFRVIRYDRRGYAQSRASEGAAYAVGDQAEDAAAILEYLGIPAAWVAGCSAGGIIALDLALRCPERVCGMLMHEPPIGAGEAWEAELCAWEKRLDESLLCKSLARTMLVFARMTGGPDPAGEGTKTDFAQIAQNMESLKIFTGKERESFLQYHKKLPEKLLLPDSCVLAAGGEDTQGLFSRHAQSAADRIGCRFRRVPGYHNLAQERPAVFAQLVRDTFFLKDNTFIH